MLRKGGRAGVVFPTPLQNVASEGHAPGKGKPRHREFAQGAGELSREEFIRFLTRNCSLLAKHSENGAVHFLCMDWRHADELLAAGREVYSELQNIVVWAKNNAGMDRSTAPSMRWFSSSSPAPRGPPTMSNSANMGATGPMCGTTTVPAPRRVRATTCSSCTRPQSLFSL